MRRVALKVLTEWSVDPSPEGPEHERYVEERAARVLAGTFEPTPGVPATRADCPPERHTTGCPYVRCRYHLWRIDGGADGERPGRPGLSSVPRDQRGLTTRMLGEAGDLERPGTTLIPRWLEHPLPASCALDESQRAQTNEEVGVKLQRHRTLVGRVLRRALEEIKERGYDVRWMLEE